MNCRKDDYQDCKNCLSCVATSVLRMRLLNGSNQGNYFENATTCSKRMRKTLVATQLFSSSLQVCKCGNWGIRDAQRIVGGSIAPPHSFPYQARHVSLYCNLCSIILGIKGVGSHIILVLFSNTWKKT
jgi:hypothetical protein